MDSNTTSNATEWPLFNKYNEFPLDHIYTFCAFTYFIPHLIRMMKSKGLAKAHHYHRSLIIAHIIVSIIEVVLFHVKSWYLGHDPKPNNIDLLLCVAQTITSLVMTERMRFTPKLTLELSRLAAYSGSTEWNRASVKMLASFVWVRLFIAWSGKFAGINTPQQRYSLGVCGGILVAIYEGSYPHGIVIYLATTFLLMALDRWASKFDNSSVDMLKFVGLVSHRVEKPSTESDKPLKKVN
ncbi:hypothetical protein CDV31_009174 [Fusarium ambrosium]|uniref:Uncharacterized protein n=1 Tax=Fusarium ambrosium TaxID=131363 RepID=A0A428TWG3_9HYPO|nr:hypothetical protein CDV31_009174 [Fusarium ambrosium]